MQRGVKAAIGMKVCKFAPADNGLRLGNWGILHQLKSDGTGERHAGRSKNDSGKLCDLAL
jgi:hypothetical protein